MGKILDRKSNRMIEIPSNRQIWQFIKRDGKWKIASFVYGMAN